MIKIRTNKDKIVDETFVLSLKNGFDNVSMKQIQEKTGLSAGSIYYHFKDKNEILKCIINRYLQESFDEFKIAVENFNGSFIEKIYFIFNYKYTSFAKKKYYSSYTLNRKEFSRKNYFTLLTSVYHHHCEIRDEFYEFNKRLYDFFYNLVQNAIESGEIRDDFDIKSVVIFILTTLKGYVELWVYQPDFSIKDLVEANTKMVWEAVRKK